MKNDTKTIKAIKGKFFNKITIQEEVNIPPEIINHLRQKWQEELRDEIQRLRKKSEYRIDPKEYHQDEIFNQAIDEILELLK